MKRFEDSHSLGEFRREVLSTVGADYGHGLLYGAGFAEGMLDGVRVTQAWSDGMRAARVAGAAIPLLFRPEQGDLLGRFSGRLRFSREAAIHTATLARAEGPACFVTAGYSAGWYSAILAETILVRETQCSACRPEADSGCRFEARRASDWIGSDAGWARDLVPFLDVDRIGERARTELVPDLPNAVAGPDADAEAACALDRSSPAAQVWGPVAVLPYAGAEDGEAALRTVRSDPEGDELRVVVVDLSDARTAGAQWIGLLRLARSIASQGLEVILAGGHFPGSLQGSPETLEAPLYAADVGQAIAWAFQLCRAMRA